MRASTTVDCASSRQRGAPARRSPSRRCTGARTAPCSRSRFACASSSRESSDSTFPLARDISERKLAEQTLREKDDALQMARTELAHVSRLTTLGELTASIAHEVNQPLGAMVANAAACARWLAAEPPDDGGSARGARQHRRRRQAGARGHRAHPRAHQAPGAAQGVARRQPQDPRGPRARGPRVAQPRHRARDTGSTGRCRSWRATACSCSRCFST